jgi:hypothetical protein
MRLSKKVRVPFQSKVNTPVPGWRYRGWELNDCRPHCRYCGIMNAGVPVAFADAYVLASPGLDSQTEAKTPRGTKVRYVDAMSSVRRLCPLSVSSHSDQRVLRRILGLCL